jgi:general secretion pathway protein L
MIYLRTGVGIELRGEDMLISSLQGNFSGEVFTHFKRIANYRLRDKEDLQGEIDLFFKSKGLSKDNIVLGIPRKDIILRHLDLPAEVADNLKQVIQYQVQSFEPTEEDRFYYDYALLDGNGNKKRLAVLLAMVKKTLLDEHLQLLLVLGIRPVAVTGGSMALSNVLLRNRKDLRSKTLILADLASSSMELLVLRHGAFVYSREVPKENSQGWSDLLLNEINEAASKIRLGSEDALDKIILTGEQSETAHAEVGAAIPDCELLKSTTDFEIPGENKPHFQEAAATLGLAYTGLARRPSIKINLLPDELRIRQTRWAYVPTAILALAIIALLAALSFHRVFQNQALIRRLDQEILSLKAPVEKVQALRSQSEAVETSIRSLDGLFRKKDMNLEVLRELTTILPSDTYLRTYSYRDGTIQLVGLSGSAPDLIPKLEKSSLLKDVVQKGQIFKDVQTGKDQFNFEAKLER